MPPRLPGRRDAGQHAVYALRVSSLPLAFAPLPADADPGTAFNDVIRVKSPFVATRLLVTVPGEYFYYPLSLDFGLTTDATVGNREVLLIVFDEQTQEVTRQPVTGSQPNVVGYRYNWNISTGAGYSDGAANFAAPLPPRLMPPGYQIGVQVNGIAAGDTGDLILSVIKVPRARPVSILPPLAVTPVIV